jgi:hypothetical protein
MNDIALVAQVIQKIASPLFTGEGLTIIGLFTVTAVVLVIKSKLNA